MQQEQIARYKSLDFFARQVVEGFITGRHRSPLHGFSVEFSDYRQYNAGESTRNIDWRLYGRTDRLYVKQFQEETNLRCQLVVDHSASMLFPLEGQGDIEHPNKLTFSVYAAAVLVELLHRQRDAFGLTLLSDGIDRQTPCRSNAAHRQHLLAELDTLLAQQRTSRPRSTSSPSSCTAALSSSSSPTPSSTTASATTSSTPSSTSGTTSTKSSSSTPSTAPASCSSTTARAPCASSTSRAERSYACSPPRWHSSTATSCSASRPTSSSAPCSTASTTSPSTSPKASTRSSSPSFSNAANNSFTSAFLRLH